MPLYYSFDNLLVNTDEFNEKKSSGEFQKFSKEIEKGKAASIEFSTGMYTGNDAFSAESPWGNTRKGNILGDENEGRTSFLDVGINKPLSIEIRHVYTGKYPQKAFFEKKKDMLVTSAMKSISTYDAAQRAVNYLLKDIELHANIRTIGANEQGTPLVYYSPALTQSSSILTLEFIFNSFPSEIFEKISSGFKAAAGVPIFASASFYLLAAGTITKILGDAGESIFDGNTVFKVTEELSFERPGSKIPVAGYRLLTQDTFDTKLLTEYSINADGILENTKGEKYNGDYPYLVLSLDGKENSDYLNFAPTAMSAAIMDKFYNVKDGKETSIDLLVDSLKLYNDWTFRKKADELNQQLKDTDKSSDKYEKLHEKYLATIANITNPLLKGIVT
ncbi:MAG: hypothetical protein ABIS01_13240 [Ferruginibacter sp.]